MSSLCGMESKYFDRSAPTTSLNPDRKPWFTSQAASWADLPGRYAACRDLPRARQLLIQALLANNQSAEAETLLDESLRLRFAAQDRRNVAAQCLNTPPKLNAECCRLALKYLSKAEEIDSAYRLSTPDNNDARDLRLSGLP